MPERNFFNLKLSKLVEVNEMILAKGVKGVSYGAVLAILFLGASLVGIFANSIPKEVEEIAAKTEKALVGKTLLVVLKEEMGLSDGGSWMAPSLTK